MIHQTEFDSYKQCAGFLAQSRRQKDKQKKTDDSAAFSGVVRAAQRGIRQWIRITQCLEIKGRVGVRRSQKQRDLGCRDLEQILFCCLSGAYQIPRGWRGRVDNDLYSTHVVCGLQGTKVFFVVFTHTVSLKSEANHQSQGKRSSWKVWKLL